MVDSEVVVPQLDLNPIAPEELQDDEAIALTKEQERTTYELAREVKHGSYPLIRQHIETLIEQYRDNSDIAHADDATFSPLARARVLVVRELKLLLAYIDDAVAQVDGNGEQEG